MSSPSTKDTLLRFDPPNTVVKLEFDPPNTVVKLEFEKVFCTLECGGVTLV